MIDNNTTEEKYISQVVLPPIEEGDNERLYLIKDRNARDNIKTLQSNLTSLNEEVNTLDTKVDNIKIPDISNLVTTDNLNNKVSNLITRSELDNTYVKWSALTSNYSNNFILNNSYAHTTNGIIDNATVDYTDVNDLYNNYAHTNANGTIDNANISYANINNLYNNYAHINNGEIDNATIDHSNINNLNTNYAHINNGTIDNANIDYANVNNLENNYAHIENGIIDNATINYSNINELENNYAHITNGKIDNATIDQAKVNNLSSNYAHITDGKIDNATINYAKIDELNSNYAHINNGIIDNASINYANINDLETNYAHITDGTIDNATISYANIDNLENNYAHINNGVIDNAKIDYGDVRFLDSHYAHISEGIIDNALIGYANVEQLDSHYAEIDMANVNNAWIENGVIKDAAISDAKIAGVSANKITAGTIDAANVNVINLRADNLTVTKINGQPVIGGYTLVDSSISDYSEKNPSNEGWYELYDNSYHQTNDIIVDSNKNYYTTSESVSLYDQNTIDNMFNNINERIDSQIETWTVDTVPLLNNEPAVNWTTNDEKNEHIGDICYVVNAASDYDGFTYRFAYDNTSHQYNWVLIQDNQVTAALGRITNLESFNNQLVNWDEATDEGVITVRGRITELSGRIDKTVKSSTQLWYTKADTTTPTAPTSQVTDTSTNGGVWTTVVPVYNVNYPNYFYCWQYQYEDNTYGWSAIIYDQATTEAQERARTGVANAITAQETADSNIKSSIQLWFTKAEIKDENDNDLYPVKPNVQVTNNSATGVTSYNRWNLVVPVYNKNYPYYFYCYQQQKGNNSYQWTDVVYDEATSTAMAKAQSALPESTFTNFEQNTFKEVTDTIDEQATSITNLTTIIDNNGLTENTTITNTVNTISQKANTNESKISSLTTALGTNADGTSKENDIIHKVSDINQNLESITTRVGKTEASLKGTYATSSTAANIQNKEATIFPAIANFELYKGAAITVKFINDNTISNPTLNINSSGAKPIKTYSGANLSEIEYAWRAGSTMTFVYDETNWCIQDSTELTRLKSAETIIDQTANNVLIKATENDSTAAQGGQHIIQSLINVAPEGIKISADKVNIEGAAIFSDNGRLSQTSLNNTYASVNDIPSDLSDLTDNNNVIPSDISNLTDNNSIIPSDLSDLTDENSIIPDISGKADKSSAIAEEQIIYIQAVSGTNSINAYPSSATTTSSYWIAQTGESIPSGTPPNSDSGQTPRWTLKRPSYQKNYPIVFVAKQRKTVSGAITCTIPIKDDTTTIIDGGHITTGTIDASQVTVNNIHADSITVGTINGNQITNGAINFDKLDSGVKDNINTISDAATSALNNLATIENVVDTLTWITEHGTMTSTTDTAIDVTKVYFILDNNGDYTVGNNKYSIVQEPNVANLSNYYELTIDKSVQNYIATHLSLTHEGLWLTPMATESNGYKVLVATGTGSNYPIAGTYIIDDSGMIIAQFTGTGIAFAENKEFTIGDDNAFIHFDGNGHINIGGSQVTIGGNTTLQQLLNKYNSTITSDDISVSKSGNTATITIGNDSVNITDGAQGIQGPQGPKGDQGDTGPQGPAGHSPAITTSKNSNGSVTIYVDGTATSTVDAGEDGRTPTVTTTKNSDGSVTIYVNGTASNTVEAGADGTSYYTYVRYSANANGSSMVTTPTSTTKYIGVYTGTSSSVPAYTSFKWSKYVGEDGNDAEPLTVTSHVVDYQLSTSGTAAPTGDWSATPLAPTTTQYLWTRTTLEFSDGTTSVSYSVGGKTGANGQNGTNGTDGGRWYAGTKITGTSTTATVFSDSGIAAAVVGDMYLNTSTYNTYRCTVAGNASAAKWVYTANIKGQTGAQGPQGEIGPQGPQGETGSAGTNGVSVTGVEHQYYLSTSNTSQAGGSWTVKPATYVKGRYYWERWKISFSSGDPTYTTATLAEEVTSAWVAIEENDEAITLKANSSDVYTKTTVDEKITQEVTDRNAAITAKANEITSTVSQTYTTKEEFENLEVGGRNLLLGSDKNTISGTGSVNKGGYGLSQKIPKGTTVILSVQIDAENVSWADSGSRRLGFEINQATDGVASGTQYISVWWGLNGTTDNGAGINYNTTNTGVTTFHGRIWSVNTLTRDFDSYEIQPNRWGIYIQNVSGGTVTVSKPKIEIGNKPTDWTPAPEDIETRVSSAESAITQNADNIALKVSESDVTGNYLVGKINLDSTTASIAAQRINLQGAVTISDLASDAQNATLNSNISVGGRNLLQKSVASAENLPLVRGHGATFVTEDGHPCYKASGGSTAGFFYGNGNALAPTLEANTTYTYSSWIKVTTTASGVTSVAHTFTSLGHHQVYNANSTASDKGHEEIASKRVYAPSTVNIGEWTYITEQFTTNNLSGSLFGKYVKVALGSDYTVYVRDMKLEKGNKATDWTPAPEDVDSAISNVAKTATSYVTDIDSNGITVHPSRSDYATNGGRAVINGDGLTIYLGSDDVASYGASARIGKPNSDRVTIDSTNGITIYKSNQSNQGIKKLQTTTNGIDIYGDDGITNIASFGETTRIGRSSQGHAEISENGFNYSQGNENIFTVEAYGEQVYELGIEYGDRVTISAGENARVSGTYDSQLVLEKPKCVYQLETGLWKEIDYSSDGEESIYYNGISSSITADSSIETWGFSVYNNTSSSITAVIAQVFDRRSVSTRIGKINSDRVTIDPTSGITIYKGNNKKLQTTTNGIDIYGDDGITNIASFGSTTRIGAQNNVQVIIESNAMSIENENDEELFKVEANRSGTTTETITVNDVAVWSNINDVTTTNTYKVDDTSAAQGAVTAIVIVDNTQYELDSSQATTTVTVGSNVTATLTSSGVTYVRGLMTVVEEDEEGIETTTYLQCSLSVRYVHIVADSAIMTLDGRQVINGERKLLTLSNDQWSSSNKTDNFVFVETKGPSNKTYAIAFGVGSSGSTRGVYDSTNGDWIIYRNSIGQTGISSSKRPIVINGTNFSVAANGDTTVRLLRTAGSIGTYNQTNSGRLRPASGTANLLSFTSYDNLKKSIGYSNIIATSNRIYRSFTVTNLKTNKTAGIYVNNYDNGNMSLSYTDGMTLHATSVDPLSAMTAAINGQTAKSLTTSYANLTLAAVTTIGSDLTISGGGIKCARAGKVMLSASAYFTEINDGNVCNIRLLIGSTVAAFVSNRGRTDRCQMVVPPRITTVAAGDVLYMAVCNTSTNAGSVDGSRTQTWMTVQYLT